MRVFIDFLLNLRESQIHPESCEHSNTTECCISFDPDYTIGSHGPKKSIGTIRFFKSVHSDGSVKICNDCYSLFLNDKFIPGAILAILKKDDR